MNPLRKDPRGGKNIPQLFANIEEILGMNSVLLKQLTEKIESWHNDTTEIGDIFQNIVTTPEIPISINFFRDHTLNLIIQNIQKIIV